MHREGPLRRAFSLLNAWSPEMDAECPRTLVESDSRAAAAEHGSGQPRASALGEPTFPIPDERRARKLRPDLLVGDSGIGGLARNACSVTRGGFAYGVDETAGDAASACADRQDDRGLLRRRHDDVLSVRRAIEEIPRGQSPLFSFNDQSAFAGTGEECFLCLLAVVHPNPLTWFEHADVDPEVRKPPLSLERAVGAKRPLVLPAGIAGVDDKPAVAVHDKPVLAHSKRGLRHRGSLAKTCSRGG